MTMQTVIGNPNEQFPEELIETIRNLSVGTHQLTDQNGNLVEVEVRQNSSFAFRGIDSNWNLRADVRVKDSQNRIKEEHKISGYGLTVSLGDVLSSVSTGIRQVDDTVDLLSRSPALENHRITETGQYSIRSRFHRDDGTSFQTREGYSTQKVNGQTIAEAWNDYDHPDERARVGQEQQQNTDSDLDSYAASFSNVLDYSYDVSVSREQTSNNNPPSDPTQGFRRSNPGLFRGDDQNRDTDGGSEPPQPGQPTGNPLRDPQTLNPNPGGQPPAPPAGQPPAGGQQPGSSDDGYPSSPQPPASSDEGNEGDEGLRLAA